MSRTAAFIFIVFAIATFMVFTPIKVTAAAPTGELDAAVIGSAEFVPGTVATVQISIQNNKAVGEISPVAKEVGVASYYGSAVGLTAILKQGNAPIIIKTDKVLLGTIASGVAIDPVPFMIEVDKDAAPGSYQILLELTYKELSDVKMSSDTVDLKWADKTVSKELKIEIKEEPTVALTTEDLDVAIVGSAEFATGTTSAVQISIQNNKTVSKKDSRAMQAGLSDYYGAATSLAALLKEGDAPVTIKTDKVLLSTIPAGSTTPPIPFTIEVNENARPGSYQMVLELTYKELSDIKMGETVDLEWVDKIISKKLKIEIKQAVMEFEVTNIEASLQPGAQKEIKITFRNCGDQTAQNAIAKLSAADPLSFTDDIAFLGDLGPNDTAIGIFGIKVKGDAIPKEYALDAQIKYTDYNGEEHISKVTKVPIKVSPSSSISEIISNHLASVLVGAGIVAVIWIIWFIWFRVKPLDID